MNVKLPFANGDHVLNHVDKKTLCWCFVCHDDYSILDCWMLTNFNSSPPTATYMLQGTGSALVQTMACSVGNSHRSACPRPTTLEEDREILVDFTLILCLWFEIHGMRTYNFLTEFQTLMAWRLDGAKPLAEPMLTYCQLDPKEHISMKLYLKFEYFHLRKCIWACCLWNGSHFVQGEMS